MDHQQSQGYNSQTHASITTTTGRIRASTCVTQNACVGAASKIVQSGTATCCRSGSPKTPSTPHQRTSAHSTRGTRKHCASLVEWFASTADTASRQRDRQTSPMEPEQLLQQWLRCQETVKAFFASCPASLMSQHELFTLTL